jgi:hypothetical protein
MRCSKCNRTWHVGGTTCPYCGASASEPAAGHPLWGYVLAQEDGHSQEAPEAGRAAISRRRFLAGLALAGGSAGLAVAGYAAARALLAEQALQQVPQLTARYVTDDLPVDDPQSPAWLRTDEQRLALQVQNVVLPFKVAPALPAVSVRSLHNGREIAFRLEWQDPHLDDLTIKTDQFRDACAVLLGTPTAVWTMGSPDDPVTILHWKADWQRDLERGFQDLEVAFPNATFDFYPPLVGVARPTPDDYPPEARHRLPALAVGNPLSQPRRSAAVEKLQAMGPGTILTLPTQNARGCGLWREGRWRVVLAKPLAAKDPGELSLEPGGSYAVAFAVWAGSSGDRGARKSITQLGSLVLEDAR